MKDLQKIGKVIRKEVLAWEDSLGPVFEPDLTGACAVASYILWRLLKRTSPDVDLVLGTFDDAEHCWVETNSQIIDLTATQFDLLPEVYITPDTDKAYSPQKRNRAVLYDFHEWPEEQNPYTHKPKIEALLRQIQVQFGSRKGKV